ncbi:hypothetical protein, partial [Klebsiella pneumoniae]|uniref:hypothetical protein n=1 Tax=Klebsiella pneumoniae TaxID=573 RepID=UPI0040557A60
MMDLGAWFKTRAKVRVHVVENMLRGYEGIIGCDILKRLGTRVRNKEGRWSIKIGGETYKCYGKARDAMVCVGAVNQAEDWRVRIR